MSNLVVLPDGNAVSKQVVNTVSLNGNVVMCKDLQQKIIAFIRVTNDKHARLVRDLIIKAVMSDEKNDQPDWAFLQSTND